jgi:hypothetical protein
MRSLGEKYGIPAGQDVAASDLGKVVCCLLSMSLLISLPFSG